MKNHRQNISEIFRF